MRTLLDLGTESFVSLTTYRRNGDPVSTAVWVARDGGALVITTTGSTGKVRRICNNDRVVLRACDGRGRIARGAQPVVGSAEVVTDEAAQQRPLEALAAKYGVQYTILMLIEKVRGNRGAHRVVLRVERLMVWPTRLPAGMLA